MHVHSYTYADIWLCQADLFLCMSVSLKTSAGARSRACVLFDILLHVCFIVSLRLHGRTRLPINSCVFPGLPHSSFFCEGLVSFLELFVVQLEAPMDCFLFACEWPDGARTDVLARPTMQIERLLF